MFGPFAKSIAAFVGLAALVSKELFGIEIGSDTQDSIVEGIMAIGTLLAVYGFRNAPR